MYMHRINAGPEKREPDFQREMLKKLDAICNHLELEASEAEIFTMRVAREVFAHASPLEVQNTIARLREK